MIGLWIQETGLGWGNLLAGLIGALLVFLLGIVREWWRNERERGALRRLLAAEIQHNTGVCSDIIEQTHDIITPPHRPSLSMETWRSIRDRAGQLLPGAEFDSVLSYYMILQDLLTELKSDERANIDFNQLIKEGYNPYQEKWSEMLVAQDLAYRSLGGDRLFYEEEPTIRDVSRGDGGLGK